MVWLKAHFDVLNCLGVNHELQTDGLRVRHGRTDLLANDAQLLVFTHLNIWSHHL